MLEGFLSADGRATELEHVSVVHEAVADRVSDSRIAERVVPSFRGHLRGDHRGRSVVTIFDHFEQVAALDVGHRVEQEVVEHEHVDARELAEQ